MPAKDAQLKSIIEEVIGSGRKGREKVIRLVQKKHPHLSYSKIEGMKGRASVSTGG